MTTKTKSGPTESFETIKIGIDAHAKWYYVGRQVDGATPQPVKKMSPPGPLRFMAKQSDFAGNSKPATKRPLPATTCIASLRRWALLIRHSFSRRIRSTIQALQYSNFDELK
jgi:hypothetical protein